MANGDSELRQQVPRAFQNRRQAGRLLAAQLRRFAKRRDVVVLALPRGGVPVAYEVAGALEAPLDVFTVRKLGVPGHEELAMGAIGSGGACALNYGVIDSLHISHDEVVQVAERERRELERREHLYRDSRPYPKVEGNIVILVDDGLATGASMLVAVDALRRQHPTEIVVAVPVAPPDTCTELREHADAVIAYQTPERFYGVGAWYQDFSQVTDAEVRALLSRALLDRVS
jgi:predicted phosphoribosyltransferase